ncbi:MAG: cytochrome P450 [Candidatus Nitrosopolaris sp.]
MGQVLDKIPVLPNVKGARQAREKLDKLVYSLIKERIESNVKNYDDLLTRLIQAQDSTRSGSTSKMTANSTTGVSTLRMSDKQVRDEVMTIAGHETTANALTWTFYLLSQNPEIEKRLVEELESIFDRDSTPSVDDISKLKFTEKVLRESMRLYPPVWSLGRYVANDYTLDKYNIPAGSTIMMSQYLIHRDPRYYNEPDSFNPERWSSEAASLPRFSYFPFGGGIRACIGESFAWMEGILLIATISRQWKMHLIPGHRVELDPAITLRAKYGMKMKLKRRKV